MSQTTDTTVSHSIAKRLQETLKNRENPPAPTNGDHNYTPVVSPDDPLNNLLDPDAEDEFELIDELPTPEPCDFDEAPAEPDLSPDDIERAMDMLDDLRQRVAVPPRSQQRPTAKSKKTKRRATPSPTQRVPSEHRTDLIPLHRLRTVKSSITGFFDSGGRPKWVTPDEAAQLRTRLAKSKSMASKSTTTAKRNGPRPKDTPVKKTIQHLRKHPGRWFQVGQSPTVRKAYQVAALFHNAKKRTAQPKNYLIRVRGTKTYAGYFTTVLPYIQLTSPKHIAQKKAWYQRNRDTLKLRKRINADE